MMFDELKRELDSIMARDPVARSRWEVYFLYSGFKAVRAYRKSHWLYEHGHYFLARWISQRARHKTGIEIHPGAKIGRGLFIDHGMGVVIGETTEIGDDCTLYQNVTLGGTGKDKGKRHPTLGNNVLIGSGAKVLGPFRVGKGSRIGAGAVVLNEVPPYCTVVGVPGRIVRRYCPKNLTGEPCEECETCNLAIEASDLDQIHMPDPVEQELQELRDKVDILEKAVTILMREAQHENI